MVLHDLFGRKVKVMMAVGAFRNGKLVLFAGSLPSRARRAKARKAEERRKA